MCNSSDIVVSRDTVINEISGFVAVQQVQRKLSKHVNAMRTSKIDPNADDDVVELVVPQDHEVCTHERSNRFGLVVCITYLQNHVLQNGRLSLMSVAIP